jgi:hypothetical protein
MGTVIGNTVSYIFGGVTTPAAIPSLSSAVISNATPTQVVLTFDSALNTTAPATTVFTLAGKTISNVSISGSSVTITVSVAYVYGNTVAISYTKPVSNPLQSLIGGVVASFTGQSVTNNILQIPTVASAQITNTDPNKVAITFNIALNESYTPSTTAFALAGKSISTVSVSGSVVTLTVSVAYTFGDSVTVDYIKPATNYLRSSLGGIVASFSSQSVTNNILQIPTLSSITVENAVPTNVVLTYNIALDETSTPATTDFVLVGKTVSGVVISGAVVTITVSVAYVYGNTISLNYTQGINKVKSTLGGLVPSFTGQSVTNNVLQIPTFSSAQIADANKDKVVITMDIVMDETSTPATSAFTLTGKTISGVVISSTTVTLTVTVPYVYGDSVTVSYTQPGSNKLKGATGGVVASFVDQVVTNNIAPVIPALVSANIWNRSSTIEIGLDLELDANSIPDISAFNVVLNGTSINNVQFDGFDSSFFFLYCSGTTFAYGDIITVSYTQPLENPLQGLDGGKVASFTDYPVTNNIEFTPAYVNVKMLFWGKVSDITAGEMPNLVTGATDALTVGGSEGSYTFQCPDTAPYIAADTDYIWFKTDETLRTTTEAELVGYDFPRTLVKYDNTTPYLIREIVILLAGVTLTETEENLLRDYMELSIWWSNVLSDHGMTKGNRSAEQSVWTVEIVTLISDTFTDTDGVHLHDHTMDVGPGWTEVAGTWVITGNKLNETANAVYAIATVDSGKLNIDISCDVTMKNMADYYNPRLAFRYADTNNYWIAYLSHDTYGTTSVILTSVVSGASGVQISELITQEDGVTHPLRVTVNNNVITVYWNGVQKIQTTNTCLNDKTVCGITSYVDAPNLYKFCLLDNYLVKTI